MLYIAARAVRESVVRARPMSTPKSHTRTLPRNLSLPQKIKIQSVSCFKQVDKADPARQNPLLILILNIMLVAAVCPSDRD